MSPANPCRDVHYPDDRLVNALCYSKQPKLQEIVNSCKTTGFNVLPVMESFSLLFPQAYITKFISTFLQLSHEILLTNVQCDKTLLHKKMLNMLQFDRYGLIWLLITQLWLKRKLQYKMLSSIKSHRTSALHYSLCSGYGFETKYCFKKPSRWLWRTTAKMFRSQVTGTPAVSQKETYRNCWRTREIKRKIKSNSVNFNRWGKSVEASADVIIWIEDLCLDALLRQLQDVWWDAMRLQEPVHSHAYHPEQSVLKLQI